MAHEQFINQYGPSFEEWIISINDDMENLAQTEPEPWRKQSIYRVPPSVRNINRRAYTPQKVSIGPYHHGEEQVKGMEEHKHRALLHFLKRSKMLIQSYVDALAPMVEDLKDTYEQLDGRWRSDDGAFLKLMIVDGCCILELMRLRYGWEGEMDYAPHDPVFGQHGQVNYIPYLKPDLLMLENQLPLPLLTKLLDVEQGRPTGELVLKLITVFFNPLSSNLPGSSLHILDVYRKSLLATPPIKKFKARGFPSNSTPAGDQHIHPATELDQAGIRLKKSKTRSLNDISFSDGVLSIPPIDIDDTFESVCLNLMAFERDRKGE